MDNNENGTEPQTPQTPTPSNDNSQIINPQPSTPQGTVTPPTFQPKKSRKKMLVSFMLVILVAAGAAGAAYYFFAKPKSPPAATPAKTAKSEVLASAKPQYAMGDSVSGYVKYDATKFKEVDVTTMPEVKDVDPNVNVVIVQANTISWDESGLYLYDLTTNKMHKLTSGGGNPRIMSDHFVLYGFDENINGAKQLGARLLDLQTGKITTVYSGSADTVPATVCCSVSPDGLRAAFAEKDKMSIWDIRTNKFQDITATINPIEPGFKRSSPTDYTTEISYATPQWQDNDTIIYADKTAVSAGDGNSAKPKLDTDIFKLTLANSKSTELTTSNTGIYDIYISGGLIYVNEITGSTGDSQITQLLADAPKEIAQNPGFVSFAPAGDKLYLFPILDPVYSVVDLKTASTASFNPKPDGVTVHQIVPKGWAGPTQMIVQVLDTGGKVNHEYIAIYDTTTDAVTQKATVK